MVFKTYWIWNTEVNDLTAIWDCVVGQMLRNSICETNGKFRQRKFLNVEGTDTSRIGRIENSQTKKSSQWMDDFFVLTTKVEE